MSHSHAPKPEKQRAGKHAAAPQVAVRDGNHLLCPCCGQLLMTLADATSQELDKQESERKSKHPLDADGLPRPTWPALEKMIARQEAAKEAAHRDAPVPSEPLSPLHQPGEPFYRADPIIVPIDPDVAAFEFPEEQPPMVALPRKPRAIMRPKRPKRPRRERFSMRLPKGKGRPKPKGFGDALTYEGTRLYAWTFYRLKALNVQLVGEICAKHEELESLQEEVAGVKKEDESEKTPSDLSGRQTTLHPERRETMMPSRSEPVRSISQEQGQEFTSRSVTSQVSHETLTSNHKPP